MRYEGLALAIVASSVHSLTRKALVHEAASTRRSGCLTAQLVTKVGAAKAAAVLVPLTLFSIPFLWAVVQYAFFSPGIFD